MQGVTTVVTNNDGGGPIDIGETLDELDEERHRHERGASTSAQGSVRGAVLGMSDAAPTPAQLDSMRALVGAAWSDGAIGMSTGLYYAPGSYATTEEVIELAKVAAAKGGIYDSHLRDESSYTIGLIGAVNEAIRIGREAKHPDPHLAHQGARHRRLGPERHGDRAHQAGARRRASTSRRASIRTTRRARASARRCCRAGPRRADATRSARASRTRRRARGSSNEMEDEPPPPRRRVDAAHHRRRATRPSSARRSTQIAAARATTSPIEAALQIIQHGDASVASFNMNEKDIEKFMVQDFVVTGSDG